MSAIEKYEDQARAKGRELADRLQADPACRQAVEADPAATLQAAGLPEHATADFLNDVGIQSEVQGYRACDSTCNSSCLISQCLISLG
jgi:hypothetical protein